MTRQFMNVGETWMLYDTVLVGNFPNSVDVPGWVTTLPLLGNLNDINFFNVRNRTIGLPYNNQDTRDQMAYGYYIDSIGISFFVSGLEQYNTWQEDYTLIPEVYNAHIFSNDLPRHASLTLKVNQDERLKTSAPLCPPGYGPFGDAVGRGQPTSNANWTASAQDTPFPVNTQGMPQLNNRFIFPTNLEVPRRASMSVTVKFSEWAREMLQLMWLGTSRGGYSVEGSNTGYNNKHYAGIQVSLNGRRLVQQRGQLHA